MSIVLWVMSIAVRSFIGLAFASAPALAVMLCTADQDCNYPGCNDMPCSFSGVAPRCMLGEGCRASLGRSSGILYVCASHGMSVQVQQHDSMLVLRPHPASLIPMLQARTLSHAYATV